MPIFGALVSWVPDILVFEVFAFIIVTFDEDLVFLQFVRPVVFGKPFEILLCSSALKFLSIAVCPAKKGGKHDGRREKDEGACPS